MLVTTGDRQVFGTNLILKIVDLVKMIQNLCMKSDFARRTVTIHDTALNTKDMHLSKQPDARMKRIRAHRENWFMTPWNVVSTG